MRKRFYLASVVLAVGLAAPCAYAGPQQGVRCPSGFDALISDSNKKLVCRKVIAFERDALCPSGGYKLENNGAAPDDCVLRANPPNYPNPPIVHRVAPTALPIVTTPWQKVVSELKQVTSPNRLDKFVATVHEFAFPELGSVYVGDASKGVGCPEGFDGDKVHNGRGIRCDKQKAARARPTATASSAGSGSVIWSATRTAAATSSPAKPGRPSPRA